MNGTDPIIEAQVGLDTETLFAEQERQKDKRGENAAIVGAGGFPAQTAAKIDERDEADEQSPLLQRRQDDGEEQDNEGQPLWPGSTDFAHLPWYKRPSMLWIVGPFFFLAIAFGGIMAPKVNLILELVCREYMAERAMIDPNFVGIPVDFNGGKNSQCQSDEVQSRVAQFTLWCNLLSGILAAIASPKLGHLSDRYGRKLILVVTSIGTILGEIVFIFAACYPATFPVPVLLLSSALDGMTGSFIVAMSICTAYATDCTPPNRRNVAFGFFHASLFTGIAIGPILAGYIVKLTGQIVIVFYILTAVHVSFALFVLLVVPESLSAKRRELARQKHEAATAVEDWSGDWINHLRAMNLFEPLKILLPTGPGTSPALRRNLLLLAAVDTIVFGVAMGSMVVIVIYVNYQFQWETFETGRYMTIVNSSRTFCLLVVLPILTRVVRGKRDPAKQDKNTGSDLFDLWVIRIAILFDTLGYLGFALTRDGGAFILSGVVGSIGGIGSPTLQSSLTKHVPADRTGQLLGAIGLLHALARIVAPTIFNAIYSATVGTFRQAVFVCLCSTFGLGFVVTWFIRPHVYFDEAKAAEEPAEEEDAGEGHRIPIVTAVSNTAIVIFWFIVGAFR